MNTFGWWNRWGHRNSGVLPLESGHQILFPEDGPWEAQWPLPSGWEKLSLCPLLTSQGSAPLSRPSWDR